MISETPGMRRSRLSVKWVITKEIWRRKFMYKEKISRYIDAHRKEMLEEIGAL